MKTTASKWSGKTEFVTISYWESAAAMSRFTGGDPTRIHHLDRDRELLIELPDRVQILHLRVSHGNTGGTPAWCHRRKICASLSNVCRESRLEICQFDSMAIDSCKLLESLKPLIKTRWETLLYERPFRPRQSTAVVTPEMLVLMIDDTLARLTSKLRSLPDRASFPRTHTHHQKAKTDCQCGLSLLMNYYLSGVRALREILAREPALDRRHICRCFNLLAREEVRALASLCRFRGSATCGLRSPKNGEIQGMSDAS